MATVISGTDGVSVNGKTLANVPAGTIAYFGLGTAPTGYLKANGATISRTTYADLFAVIGTTYGSGDGSTTFAIPDLRGEFIRSLDDGRGVDSGRSIGSHQKGSIMMIASDHEMIMGNSKAGQFWDNGEDITWIDHERTTSNLTDNGKSSNPFSQAVWDTNIGAARPRNNALLACIKY